MPGYEVYIVGEHLVFTLFMALLLVGLFTIVSLVMLWAPSAPLLRKFGDRPGREPADAPAARVNR